MSFFFFKQKTAYEMRISDWSSDVCSSDLAPAADAGAHSAEDRRDRRADRRPRPHRPRARIARGGAGEAVADQRRRARGEAARTRRRIQAPPAAVRLLHRPGLRGGGHARSEEHTSELQSLMRTSYAVFCLQKKKKKRKSTSESTTQSIS